MNQDRDIASHETVLMDKRLTARGKTEKQDTSCYLLYAAEAIKFNYFKIFRHQEH